MRKKEPSRPDGVVELELAVETPRRPAAPAGPTAKSEAPTMPPPKSLGGGATPDSLRGAVRGRSSGTRAAVTEAVVADLRKDPRSEK